MRERRRIPCGAGLDQPAGLEEGVGRRLVVRKVDHEATLQQGLGLAPGLPYPAARDAGAEARPRSFLSGPAGSAVVLVCGRQQAMSLRSGAGRRRIRTAIGTGDSWPAARRLARHSRRWQEQGRHGGGLRRGSCVETEVERSKVLLLLTPESGLLYMIVLSPPGRDATARQLLLAPLFLKISLERFELLAESRVALPHCWRARDGRRAPLLAVRCRALVGPAALLGPADRGPPGAHEPRRHRVTMAERAGSKAATRTRTRTGRRHARTRSRVRPEMLRDAHAQHDVYPESIQLYAMGFAPWPYGYDLYSVTNLYEARVNKRSEVLSAKP